ncbi:MAG: GxxExxY protein [Phycisphaeraceae bacterium]|nr:GxxExxY protein [Phycisphaeraceae bacterium]
MHGDNRNQDQRSGRGGQRGRGVPLSELDPALTEVSRKLIGCAIEVHKALGPGYAQEVYQRAVELELTAAGVPFESAVRVPVLYRGQNVGEQTADLMIDGRFVVSVLAHRGDVSADERSAVRALLRAADKELGLVINFAERRLKDGLVRVLNPDKIPSLRGHDGEHEAVDEAEH